MSRPPISAQSSRSDWNVTCLGIFSELFLWRLFLVVVLAWVDGYGPASTSRIRIGHDRAITLYSYGGSILTTWQHVEHATKAGARFFTSDERITFGRGKFLTFLQEDSFRIDDFVSYGLGRFGFARGQIVPKGGVVVCRLSAPVT